MPDETTQPAAAAAATRTIDLPSGKKAELKNRLNIREHNTLKKTLYSGVQITNAGDDTNAPQQEINGDIMVKVEEKLVELSLVAYGEIRTNPAEALMSSNALDDYAAIVKELEPFTKDLFPKPSK